MLADREGIEMHLAGQPVARQGERGRAAAAAGVGGHGSHLLPGHVGHEAHRVGPRCAGADTAIIPHLHPALAIHRGCLEPRQRHASASELQRRGIHLHLARHHPERAGVDAGEAVALREAAPPRQGAETAADGRQQGLRRADHVGETRALLELRGCARVGDVRAVGADHPLPAQPTAHHGAHLARETSQDALIDFCHSRRYFCYIYNISPRGRTAKKRCKKSAFVTVCPPLSPHPTP